jgi:light-regulated signal transduction histidine kinase (bacteriophytochrome)/CheY-like chemotaxis protein
MDSGIVDYASDNIQDIFGLPVDQVLGQDVGALMGRAIWHSFLNLGGQHDFGQKRQFAGLWQGKDKDYAVHCSKGGEYFVIEIEGEAETPIASPEMLREQALLIDQIEHCDDLNSLSDLTARLLRHVTDFDRVMVIRFDPVWNGEVVAESRLSFMEPLLGLRFPATDIPVQAREIMAKLPLRLIADADQSPVPIVASGSDKPPLDITYANCRGVSPVHMQYLKNMDVAATMTLSITLRDELWGYVSFHSRRPYVVSPDIRHILLGFLPVLRLKVDLIRRAEALKVSNQVDDLQTKVQRELEGETELDEILNRVGPSITNVLDACGVVMTSGSQNFSFGDVPETSVISAIAAKAVAGETRSLATDCLSQDVPGVRQRLDGFAGALVTLHEGDRSLQVFRKEISQSVSWAGNPEKTIEEGDGNLRLEPRRSFSEYLQDVSGRSKAWSRDDIHIMRQLWPLLGAAERRAFLADLNRQQTLMINELNHRVRNILSLVKSVSTQARRTGGSLESYSNALEARIHALAAAHDIGAGAARTSVSIRQIILLEAKPFDEDQRSRVTVRGTDASIRAEAAPIFALVIHELMTNAVKYGALSTPDGTVDVELYRLPESMRLIWSESGGPPVAEPKAEGFGSTLIRQAVPYEMGGTSSLLFEPGGARAEIELPSSALGDEPGHQIEEDQSGEETEEDGITKLRNGLILLLEDNFMIAEGMRAELQDAGFVNVETLASADAALRFLEKATPALALLDVNLGNGLTSEAVARELQMRDVPILFVTGYGEQNSLPAHLRTIPVLTKPVAKRDLLTAVGQNF